MASAVLSPAENNYVGPQGWRFGLAFTSLCVCNFLVALDLVIVAPTIQVIAVHLNATSNQVFWCGTGYVLAQTIVQPLYGSLSEVFGRKILLQTALIIFLVASILCAEAQSIKWLIACRVVQGVGGGGLIAMTSLITADVSTLQERSRYIGYLSLAYAFGVDLGFPVGASLAQYLTWRWIFYLNIPTCVIAFAGIWMFLKLHLPSMSLREKLHQVDWLGTVVFAASCISLLLGITSGGVLYPWNSASTIVPIVLGVLGLLTFVMIEEHLAVAPIMTLDVFRNMTASVGFFSSFCHGFIILAVSYYQIIYFRAVGGYGLLHAALLTLPVLTIVGPFAIVAGNTIAKRGKIRFLLWSAWCLNIAGFGAMTIVDPQSTLGEQIGPQVLIAAGIGILYPTVAIVCQAPQPDHLEATSINMFAFFRSFGSCFGIAIGGTIFQNQFNHQVDKFIGDDTIPRQYKITANEAEAAYSLLHQFPVAVYDTYKQVYSGALQKVWYCCLGVTSAALLISLLAKPVSVNKGIRSKQRFIEEQRGQSDYITLEESAQ